MATLTAEAFSSSTIGGYTSRTTAVSPTLASGTDSLASIAIDTNTDNLANKAADLVMGVIVATEYNTTATCTITITAFTELNSTDKINLIATDGTNYDFVNGDQSSVAGTWESTTSNDATATNLMNVINTSSGPAGTRFTATVDGAVVTVTQATGGVAGNTTVTLTDTGTAGMSKTNFTGGGGPDLVLQVSHDKASWVTAVTLDSELDGTVGVFKYYPDTTRIVAPYFRMLLNSGGVDIGTSGTSQFFFSHK